jgi:hypothetical protein
MTTTCLDADTQRGYGWYKESDMPHDCSICNKKEFKNINSDKYWRCILHNDIWDCTNEHLKSEIIV